MISSYEMKGGLFLTGKEAATLGFVMNLAWQACPQMETLEPEVWNLIRKFMAYGTDEFFAHWPIGRVDEARKAMGLKENK